MRLIGFMLILMLAGFGAARPAAANCVVLAQLDEMHALQTNMARRPNAALFPDTIRRLRRLAAVTTLPQVQRAVAGNRWVGQGAVFRQFVGNTQTLLQRASVDDPFSVRRHFGADVMQNLQAVGTYMTGMRCSPAAVAQARAALNDPSSDATSTLSAITAFVGPTSLVIAATLLALIGLGRHLFRRRILLQRKRAKRHRLAYATRSWWNERLVNVTLLDVNKKGARVRHQGKAPPKGADVDIAIANDWATGTIVWSDRNDSGVRFKNELSAPAVGLLCASVEVTY